MTFWFTVLDHGNVVFFVVRGIHKRTSPKPIRCVDGMALLAPPDACE
jgi:hypothetical protein